jgi:hypothetical protein
LELEDDQEEMERGKKKKKAINDVEGKACKYRKV